MVLNYTAAVAPERAGGRTVGTHYRGAKAEVRSLDAWIKLARACAAVRGRLEDGLRAAGLTEKELGVLEALLHLGPLRQCDLGRKQLTSRANVTLIVDKLVDRGWVAREADPEDRRAVRVVLTAAGRRFIGGVFPGHVADVVAAMGALAAAEQEELARLCRKLGLANARE